MSVNLATNLLAITEDQIFSYFKSRGAISESTAIDIDIEELKSKLDIPEFVINGFSEYPYIKSTSDGKYYLNDYEYSKQNKVILYVILVIGVIMFMPLVFGIVGYLLSL